MFILPADVMAECTVLIKAWSNKPIPAGMLVF